jgi:hypothetical protein
LLISTNASLSAGKQTSVTISMEGTNGYVIVDAVQFAPTR